MEAAALQAPAGLTRGRGSIALSLLRLRSDEQLVELFRAGHEEAFALEEFFLVAHFLSGLPFPGAWQRQAMYPQPRFGS